MFREKVNLQHEIEEKEDLIRQRNGEIQVHYKSVYSNVKLNGTALTVRLREVSVLEGDEVNV